MSLRLYINKLTMVAVDSFQVRVKLKLEDTVCLL